MRYFLSLFVLLISFQASQARVRIFATDPAPEKSALLVKGDDLRGISACLWLFHEADKANICDQLRIRVNQARTRAKIYLPSVDKNMGARLYVTTENGRTEQEFLINISDVVNERKNFLSHFKLFTPNSKKKGYSLSVNKDKKISELASSSPDMENGEFSDLEIKTDKSIYVAQDLTFNKKRRRNTSKRRRTRFSDLMRIKPRDLPPPKARLGYIYVDSSNALCIYMDDKWQKIVGSGHCK